ncbi:SAGA-associated factor 29 [Hondaea fermentalgiana]|uniref:SAGA-associated factor 29 n=1 Tax=Hondaea fermentalgiana TaxID=2315210 RepID=A0A2R5GGI3_9STRA|nr:SAGA-associated factor 29 [Hondaea fermentalgiana]|eukprot:GBG29705.1 SAGA-associated factor 29 [Hondaea fermentalgiana]
MNDYPRNLHIDLSKLRAQTLKRYAWYYHLDAKTTARADLASKCAQHFLCHYEVDEGEVLKSFVNFCQNPNATSARGKNAAQIPSGLQNRAASTASTGRPMKRSASSVGAGSGSASNGTVSAEPPSKKRKQQVVPEGRLVAAKIKDNWMLCRVVKYTKRKRVYKVEDADEMAKEKVTFDVAHDDLIVLPTEDELAQVRPLNKGTRVLARFPKTSTFYDATVVRKVEKSKRLIAYGLRFDGDDRDEKGAIRVVEVSAEEVVLPDGSR